MIRKSHQRPFLFPRAGYSVKHRTGTRYGYPIVWVKAIQVPGTVPDSVLSIVSSTDSFSVYFLPVRYGTNAGTVPDSNFWLSRLRLAQVQKRASPVTTCISQFRLLQHPQVQKSAQRRPQGFCYQLDTSQPSRLFGGNPLCTRFCRLCRGLIRYGRRDTQPVCPKAVLRCFQALLARDLLLSRPFCLLFDLPNACSRGVVCFINARNSACGFRVAAGTERKPVVSCPGSLAFRYSYFAWHFSPNLANLPSSQRTRKALLFRAKPVSLVSLSSLMSSPFSVLPGAVDPMPTMFPFHLGR